MRFANVDCLGFALDLGGLAIRSNGWGMAYSLGTFGVAAVLDGRQGDGVGANLGIGAMFGSQLRVAGGASSGPMAQSILGGLGRASGYSAAVYSGGRCLQAATK